MASVEELRLAFVITQRSREQVEVAPAIEALVATYSSLLFRVAHSVLRDRAEAEDVVQDTFMRVLRHHHKLHAVLDPRVWLVRIAWNLALDRKRRIRPEQLDAVFIQGLVAGSVPADQAIEESQRLTSALRELERLPKKEREALLLSSVDEMSTAEMAEVLGKSESAVRALLFRARTRLRERLEQKNEKGSR